MRDALGVLYRISNRNGAGVVERDQYELIESGSVSHGFQIEDSGGQ